MPCACLPAKPVQPCPARILRENAQREAAELAAARSAALRAEEERTAAWAAAPQVGVVAASLGLHTLSRHGLAIAHPGPLGSAG